MVQYLRLVTDLATGKSRLEPTYESDTLSRSLAANYAEIYGRAEVVRLESIQTAEAA